MRRDARIDTTATSRAQLPNKRSSVASVCQLEGKRCLQGIDFIEVTGGERGITRREAPRPFGAALRVLAKPTTQAFRHHGARYYDGLKRTLRALSLSVVAKA